MTPFEYISVIISVILGCGVAQIVTGLAHFAHSGTKVKLYWPHMLWILMIFFFHLQEWWVFWEYKSRTVWTFPVFIFVLLYPIGLFIQARMLFPFDNFEEKVDLKKFYFENYRIYCSIIRAQTVLSLIDNMILRGMKFEEQIVQIGMITIMFSIAIFKLKADLLHKVLALILLIGVVAGLVGDFAGAPIK